MAQVIVVGTVHAEKGLANVEELVTILEHFQPQVIFLEVPVGHLDEYFARPELSLEACAVNRYLVDRAVPLVAVDRPTPPADFFQNDEQLHREIERRSPQYCRAIDHHIHLTREQGFEYLNSYRCMRLGADFDNAIVSTLREIGDPAQIALHQLWLDTNRLREEEIVTNVERHAAETPFSVGMLLIGVAHLPGLMRASRDCFAAGTVITRWEFSAALDECPTQA